MEPVKSIQTIELFPPLSAELVALLTCLSNEDWGKPTACPSWTVTDVAAHLLGGSVGRISLYCDQLPKILVDLKDQIPRPNQPIQNNTDLVNWINYANAEWVKAAKIFSTKQLIEFLQLTDQYVYQVFKMRPADEPARISVAWAGDTQSPNWFDIAREYTEKWLHQQHIRKAVNQPGLVARRWLFPVLDTFMRALPYTYRNITASEGTAISFHIIGDAGGDWSLVRQNNDWQLFSGKTATAVSMVELNQDLAWRLFTKDTSLKEAPTQIQIKGDRNLGAEIVHMVSIIA